MYKFCCDHEEIWSGVRESAPEPLRRTYTTRLTNVHGKGNSGALEAETTGTKLPREGEEKKLRPELWALPDEEEME